MNLFSGLSFRYQATTDSESLSCNPTSKKRISTPYSELGGPTLFSGQLGRSNISPTYDIFNLWQWVYWEWNLLLNGETGVEPMSGLHPPTSLLNLPRPALKVKVPSPRVLAKTQQGWPLDVVPLCSPNLLLFQVWASILILFRFFLVHTHSSLK